MLPRTPDPMASTGSDLMRAVAVHPANRPLFPGWTAGRLIADVSRIARDLAEGGLAAGEPVLLPLANSPASVAAMLGTLAMGARPILLSPDTPDPEAERLAAGAGAGRRLVIRDEPVAMVALTGLPGAVLHGEPGVLLPTSGSTGAPKLIARSEASLVEEGRRYEEGLPLGPADRVAIPLPVSHAYALGWLAGTLKAGAEAILLDPTALTAAARAMADGATIVILTPNLARIMAMRQTSGEPPFTTLRCVMVGAGPVDQNLDDAFHDRFGVRLARNYGSSETGALFAALPPVPARCVGRTLPGVKVRLVTPDGTECPRGETGLLEVAMGNAWHPMGDLACADDMGRFTIMGRQNQSIRRGDRWVSPLEVEEVLRQSADVADVHITAASGRNNGDDRLVADVVPVDPDSFDATQLLRHAATHLAAHKIPDRIRVRTHLRRTAAGKVVAPPVYAPAAGGTIAEAARAYKRSELLFALMDVGVLSALDGARDTVAVAEKLDLQLEELESALDTAAALGLVRRVDGRGSQGAFFNPAPLIALEAMLSRSWTSRSAISDVLRTGTARRPFATADLPPALTERYAEAMHGPHAHARTLRGLHLLRPPPAARVLEISAGPGRYLGELLHRDTTVTGTLVQVGRLSGPSHPMIGAARNEGRITGEPDGAYDLCILCNAIHGPAPGNDLARHFAHLKSGGRLLVDDLFLPDQGPDAGIGLDWLTHGGTAFRTVVETESALRALGGTVRRLDVPGEPLFTLFIITKEG